MVIPFIGVSQEVKKVEIIGARYLEGIKTDSGDVKKLIGNARFKHDDVTLRCDTAILNSKDNTLRAVGKVKIIQSGGVTIDADRLFYDGNSSLAQLFDNITLRDDRGVLTTDRLNYTTDTRVGRYFGGGKLVDKDNVLTSEIGYYYANENNAFFRKNVELNNKEYHITSDTLKYNTTRETAWFFGPTNIEGDNETLYCEKGYYNSATGLSKFGRNAKFQSGTQYLWGDSLVYNELTGKGYAKGNITFKDTAENIILNGNFAKYNEFNESVVVTDKAMLVGILEGDSLFVHADTMKSEKVITDSLQFRKLRAYYNVRMFKSDFQAVADSLNFNTRDSILACFGSPALWVEGTQLTGDTVRIKMKEGKIDRLFLINSAFVVYPEEENKERFNQIKGRNMEGIFKENKLNKLFVEGNGQSVYFAREDSSGAYIGINRADCSNMVLRFKDNNVNSITFLTKPDAMFYPLDQAPKADIQLRGLNWRITERPATKNDIFITAVEPVQKKGKEELSSADPD